MMPIPPTNTDTEAMAASENAHLEVTILAGLEAMALAVERADPVARLAHERRGANSHGHRHDCAKVRPLDAENPLRLAVESGMRTASS